MILEPSPCTTSKITVSPGNRLTHSAFMHTGYHAVDPSPPMHDHASVTHGTCIPSIHVLSKASRPSTIVIKIVISPQIGMLQSLFLGHGLFLFSFHFSSLQSYSIFPTHITFKFNLNTIIPPLHLPTTLSLQLRPATCLFIRVSHT